MILPAQTANPLTTWWLTSLAVPTYPTDLAPQGYVGLRVAPLPQFSDLPPTADWLISLLTLIPAVGHLLLGLWRDHFIFKSILFHQWSISPPLNNNNKVGLVMLGVGHYITKLHTAIIDECIGFPDQSRLPNNNRNISFQLVGEDTFALKKWPMSLQPHKSLQLQAVPC